MPAPSRFLPAAFAAVSSCLSAVPATRSAENAPVMPPEIRAIMENSCYDCHADGAKKGNVTFDAHGSEAALLADRELWHRVLKNVRAGLMPPPEKKSQPSPEERAALAQWIKTGVFQLDAAKPFPGKPVLRRLNRTEYRNTVKDLTGVDFRTDEEFPADDTGHGFDNLGEVLTVSPMMLEKYLAAAQSIVQRAVPQVERVMPEDRVWGNRFRRITTKEDGTVEKGAQLNVLSYYEPATVTAEVWVKHPGRYTLFFDLRGREKYVEGETDDNLCNLHFKLDGAELGKREFGHAGGREYTCEYQIELKEGKHELSVTLERLTPDAKSVRSLGMELEHVTLRGPDDRQFWNRPENYARWFPRDTPADEKGRMEYAREILSKFATRAFRRPADDATMDRLAGLAASVWSQPDQSFAAGISRAMEAILASPRFLFREEFAAGSPPQDGGYPFIDDYSLASRLSYFLWSTMPDAELLRLAGEGKLRAELGTQFQRLLADDRSKAFVRNFAGQWLQARDVEGIPIDARFVVLRDQKPDPEAEKIRQRFQELRRKRESELTNAEKEELEKLRNLRRRERLPDVEFTGEMRRDMRRETEMYFEYIMRENRPLTELIDSGYTFLNGRLAAHYGVDGVQGNDFRKVVLPAGSPRGGVLTQGTVLAVTSNPTRTSPVKRGLFILDNFLGTPPPPPPPDIPALEDSSRGRGSQASLRETLLKHRAEAQCASCHNRMDPLGLAFENFNAMGKWRDAERGSAIDATGALISGENFNGAAELKRILVSNHREAFHRCFIEKLLMYALGRSLTWADEITIDQLLAKLNDDGGKSTALLRGIVESDAFLRMGK